MSVGVWTLVVFAVGWIVLIVGGYFYLRPFRRSAQVSRGEVVATESGEER